LPPQTAEEGFLFVLEELVMPLLERFQPELIINSAGQDNHFTDPITNMNFSAGGYAALNARLKPDIAVLEGGYALEDALPYVNVGIIMAMAGLDTSCVKEPNYDRDYKPQSPEVTFYIQGLVEQLRAVFLDEKRPGTTSKEGEIIQRTEIIYYDTDDIQETQNERIRSCSDCAGTLAIESRASTGSHILGVHIPLDACPKCRETGYQWFEKGSKGKSYDRVYLQDRPSELFDRR